jgi:hypothetical protein
LELLPHTWQRPAAVRHAPTTPRHPPSSTLTRHGRSKGAHYPRTEIYILRRNFSVQNSHITPCPSTPHRQQHV